LIPGESKNDPASFCRKRLGKIINMFGLNLTNYLREEISTLIKYTEEIPGDAAYEILHEDEVASLVVNRDPT